jgi:soluble lytic murein transglycosylase-like protein
MGNLIIIIGSVILLIGGVAAGNVYSSKYDPLYQKYAPVSGLSWKWLKAIALTESGQNPKAVNYDEGQGRHSVGLMQILYPDTFENLRAEIGVNYSYNDLLNPDINIYIAASLLGKLKKRYSTMSDIIASYNSGRPIRVNGKYINQYYVDRVFYYYRRL